MGGHQSSKEMILQNIHARIFEYILYIKIKTNNDGFRGGDKQADIRERSE